MKGKKVLIGVTGSIAAYKTATLVRLLVKSGAEVKVVMTAGARDFITPLTLATLSKHPVSTSYFDPEDGSWNNHVELGMWADLFLIAPASANTLAKMASGICDNLLLAVYLSSRCPVWVSPAMDLDMWKHASTRDNIETLKRHGVVVMDPADGELASGLSGEGRMQEPEELFNKISSFFVNGLSLAGVKALVTAGPTWETIDPVRFIGNRSSGKMGIALAEELAQRGAEVTLVSGPSVSRTVHPSVRTLMVESSDEMYDRCMDNCLSADLIVMAAAVADFKIAAPAHEKIKKKGAGLDLKLVPTKDILSELGKLKKAGQTLVGFALETENEELNALDKLKRKNLDYIVLNSLKDEGAGFGHDTNRIRIFSSEGIRKDYALKSKKEVAADIIDVVAGNLKK